MTGSKMANEAMNWCIVDLQVSFNTLMETFASDLSSKKHCAVNAFESLLMHSIIAVIFRIQL